MRGMGVFPAFTMASVLLLVPGCTDLSRCESVPKHGGDKTEGLDACKRACDDGKDGACEILNRYAPGGWPPPPPDPGTMRPEEMYEEFTALTYERIGKPCDDGADIIVCARNAHTALRLNRDRDAARTDFGRACAMYLRDPEACDIDVTLSDGAGDSKLASRCKRDWAEGLTRREYAEACVADCFGEESCDFLLRDACLADVAACEASCEQGKAARCRTLGAMYDDGEGVAQNEVRADEFYAKACKAGDEWSCAERRLRPYTSHRKLYPADLAK